MADLLTPTDIRRMAESLDVTPTKRWGQNFVVDAGTVRRIATIAGLESTDHVVEVGPGLGSLTLALLETGARVTAVEIDPRLAAALPETVAERAPAEADRLAVVAGDALRIGRDDVEAPTALVANLPYNVSVPVILHALATFPELTTALVMVQAEVADRIVAPPGSRTYGIPSAKVAWYGQARKAGDVGRAVFFPVPRVDSALVKFERHVVPREGDRAATFAVIDAAFAQRRKALRGALRGLIGSTEASSALLESLDIDPLIRGEKLAVDDFARIAAALPHFRTENE